MFDSKNKEIKDKVKEYFNSHMKFFGMPPYFKDKKNSDNYYENVRKESISILTNILSMVNGELKKIKKILNKEDWEDFKLFYEEDKQYL